MFAPKPFSGAGGCSWHIGWSSFLMIGPAAISWLAAPGAPYVIYVIHLFPSKWGILEPMSYYELQRVSQPHDNWRWEPAAAHYIALPSTNFPRVQQNIPCTIDFHVHKVRDDMQRLYLKISNTALKPCIETWHVVGPVWRDYICSCSCCLCCWWYYRT